MTVRARAGDYPRPADYLRALRSEEAVREEEALSRFDVVFLRYNPLLESAAHAGSPVIDLCWRLRLGGTLVINDPEGVRRAGSGMYLADLPRRGPGADPGLALARRACASSCGTWTARRC